MRAINISFITVSIFLSVKVAYSSNCERIKTSQQVLQCAIERHPLTKKMQLEIRKNEHWDQIASQRPNPNFEAWGTAGRMLGDTMVQFEARLNQELELGGKRSSRIEIAESQNKITETKYLQTREEIALSTVRSLYRIRQLQVEQKTVERAVKTWNTISSQYRSRPALNPEQQASLLVFHLATKDAELLLSQMKVEILEHVQFLETATGETIDPQKITLPHIRDQYPVLNENDLIDNSRIRLAQNELREAESQLQSSHSMQIPNLRLGPVWQAQTQGPIAFQSLGLSINFALPMSHNYGAQVNWGEKSVDQANQLLQLSRYRLNVEKKREYSQYHLAVETLKKAGSLDEIEKGFASTEKLFNRGVLPTILVIEANRQMFDLVRSINFQELNAVLCLWNIYVLEGRFENETLD